MDMSNKNALYEVWERYEGGLPKLLKRFSTKEEAEAYVHTQDSEKNDGWCYTDRIKDRLLSIIISEEIISILR